MIHAGRDDHGELAGAIAQRHAVGIGIGGDDRATDGVDVAGDGARAGPQMQPGKGKQARAGADIGQAAHHRTIRLHVRQHRQATGGGGVLAGAKGLAGGDQEIADARFVHGRIFRGVDVEGPFVDRLDALLAERDPVFLGQLLDHHRRRAIGEQGGDGVALRFARFVGQPGFQLPLFGLVLGNLAAGDHDVGVPVEHVFVGDQCGLDDGTRRKDGDFPAHGAGLCGGAASLASVSSSRARPLAA